MPAKCEKAFNSLPALSFINPFKIKRHNMDDVFKVYVDQLRDGQERQFNDTLSPDFLEIKELDLAFDKPVQLIGSAYLAEHELVLHWDIVTEATIPCSICNEPVMIPIHVKNFYYAVPLSEIKSGIYNIKDLLRETIVLEVPAFTECEGGNCPRRQEIKKYLKETSGQEDEGYQPFADLDWKDNP